MRPPRGALSLTVSRKCFQRNCAAHGCTLAPPAASPQARIGATFRAFDRDLPPGGRVSITAGVSRTSVSHGSRHTDCLTSVTYSGGGATIHTPAHTHTHTDSYSHPHTNHTSSPIHILTIAHSLTQTHSHAHTNTPHTHLTHTHTHTISHTLTHPHTHTPSHRHTPTHTPLHIPTPTHPHP